MKVTDTLNFNINDLPRNKKAQFIIRWLKDSGYYNVVRNALYKRYLYGQDTHYKNIIELIEKLLSDNRIEYIFHPDFLFWSVRDKEIERQYILLTLLSAKWSLFLVNNTRDIIRVPYNVSFHKSLLRQADYLLQSASGFHIEDFPYDLTLELLEDAPKVFIHHNFKYRFDRYFPL